MEADRNNGTSFEGKLQKFNSFLKGNLQKRERAYKKLNDDREAVQRRILEINSLKAKCMQRRNIFLSMKKMISKHSIYQRYLENVLGICCGEFRDLEDPLKRLEVLVSVKQQLEERQIMEMQHLENSKSDMLKFIQTKLLEVIGLNTTLASIHYKSDDTYNRTLDLEKVLVDVKVKISNLMIALLANKETINNIYYQICKRKNILEKYHKKNIFDKLVHINQSIKGFEATYFIINEKKGKTKRRKSTNLKPVKF
ncbi:hypothetical protein HHI36_022232 [Cryptolaemus montrouzieri]|uniref:DUF4200 domain-containing protein n=1 Tax=Cryptolaemus montrouzieri TaxID=559131 RepID=A0ABD2MZZ5_9CUCU